MKTKVINLNKKYSKTSFLKFLFIRQDRKFTNIFAIITFCIISLPAISFKESMTNKNFINLIFVLVFFTFLLLLTDLVKLFYNFWKKDSYNAFLVSNFIYKTRLIRHFHQYLCLSLKAKIDFINNRNAEKIINEDFILSSGETLKSLYEKANNLYTNKYFCENEKYELLTSDFKKLYNSNYIIKSLNEDYFWSTKKDFLYKALKEESNLENFDNLIKDLLAETERQQNFLLMQLKKRKILPKDFYL